MSLIDGIGNTAIAPGAMEYLLHGNYNTAISPYALRDVQGDGNVALGNRAGMLWTGSDRLTEWSGHCFEARKYHAGTAIRRDAVAANSTRKLEA